MEFRAKQFADAAHAGQKRKYTGEPYISHPVAVADLVRSVPHTPAMVVAALLHDVVEDTLVTLDEIERVFGFEVVVLVEMLTDVSRQPSGAQGHRPGAHSQGVAGSQDDQAGRPDRELEEHHGARPCLCQSVSG